MNPLKLNLLAIDDDNLILDALQSVISEPWNFIRSNHFQLPSETIHVAFVDLHLSDNFKKQEGLEVIRSLSEHNPHIEIVAISGDLSRELMEKSLKAGATRFLPKPLTPEEVLLTLQKLEALFQLRWAGTSENMQWIGSGKASDQLRRQIALLKGERGPILIEGESGTGKEVVAHLLHQQEDTRPFISINVASIPDNLFESEFFGYSKGAFTGAQHSKMGLAESANGGDLFLDEIEALPLNQQAKLLRFLENGELRRVGSNEVVHIETRIIAATNENLNKKVAAGEFREDLLWRLSGHKIQLPALRERKEDVPDLCHHFVKTIRPVRNKQFSEDALIALQNYGWPGNVRELKRICEQVVLQSPLPWIRSEDLSHLIHPSGLGPTELRLDLQKGMSQLLSDFEKKILESALQESTDVDALAKILQISRSSLYKKLKDHNLSL